MGGLWLWLLVLVTGDRGFATNDAGNVPHDTGHMTKLFSSFFFPIFFLAF